MPWKDVTTVSQRYERVRLYLEGTTAMTTWCTRFGVARKTAYTWVERYRAGGRAALVDQSRRPHTAPTRTPPEQEARVLALAEAHPTWGGKKLHVALRDAGMAPVPVPGTITKILRRAGRLRDTPVEPRSYGRFARDAPNELWQVDFKGWHRLRTGTVHPLSVLDDHSRYLLVLHATADQERAAIQPILTECFRTYGLPWELLADNGPPWGTSKPDARTGLDIWLMQLGIVPIHGRPLHPQTQGKVERFHRTLKADVIVPYTCVLAVIAQRPHLRRWEAAGGHKVLPYKTNRAKRGEPTLQVANAPYPKRGHLDHAGEDLTALASVAGVSRRVVNVLPYPPHGQVGRHPLAA